MKHTENSRRQFLREIASLGLLTIPMSLMGRNAFLFNDSAQLLDFSGKRKRVVLLELFGGNDNLNTLVPYTDDLYKHLRPELGLKASEIIKLNENLAFNNALQPLMDVWNRGELAIIQGVGYPNPNTSHFQSIKIIEKGSGAEKIAKSSGWISDVIDANQELQTQDIKAVWSGGHQDSLIGNDMNFFNSNSYYSGEYLDIIKNASVCENCNASEMKLYNINNELRANYNNVKDRLKDTSRFAKDFSFYADEQKRVGDQFKSVLKFIESGIDSPVFKLGISGFDMHDHLRGSHEKLLNFTAMCLDRFQKALIDLDEWDNTLILVYSEFGRRPKENGSKGTDHGTAGPMFMLGGQVKGGIKGARTMLDDLDAHGNLKYTMDYRSVYSTIIDHWWQVPNNPIKATGFEPLGDIIKG